MKINPNQTVRSVSFVSLDTHPANNSLVVTYEILISVVEKSTNRELTRRSKRDQLQVNISALDNLIKNELRQSDRLALSLRALSEEIISKCPLLSPIDHNQNIIEDIQLNLLYLINRRQTQLISANHPVPNRPQSSASMTRLKSATTMKDNNRLVRGASGRQKSALSSSGSSRESLNEGDVYDYLLAKEKSTGGPDDALDMFVQEFQVHLEELQQNLPVEIIQDSMKNQTDLESKLEGLYGEETEKLASILAIRRASCDDQQLLWMSSNRILICAILRTLRDTKANSGDKNHGQLLRESILFCLIRLTTYADIYTKLFVDNKDDMSDLLRVIVDSLDELVKISVKLDDYKYIQSSYHNLNALLVLLLNLLHLDDDDNDDAQSSKRNLIQVHSGKLLDSFAGLLGLFAKHLSRDLRQSMINRRERIVCSLSRLLAIIQPLSIYREFIQLYRVASQRRKSDNSNSLDCLINILNILQLSRPGSGTSATSSQNQVAVIRDQATLNEIYELEMQILRLINNLLLDSRLKTRIIKKNLALKCILRNIIVFLATKSRTSNTLSPFNRSSTLLVPFRCLYELSCCDQIKAELFKSKIIIKCLLEYLLSSSTDLKLALNLLDSVSSRGHTKVSDKKKHRNDTTNEIIIEPNDASHYIVCLWLNLSSKSSALFYNSSEMDLHEPIREYIELTIENIGMFVEFCSKLVSNNQPIEPEVHLMIYIHVKLVRNLSQFYRSDHMDDSQLASWIGQLSKTSDILLQRSDLHEFALLSVECLAILTHLIRSSAELSMESTNQLEPTRRLLIRLLEVNFAHHLEAENDDLILVSVNFLGILSKYHEICPEIRIIFVKILEACDFILENKSTDTEMIVSCLFSLSQLLEHKSFLDEIIGSLNIEETQGDAQGRHRRQLVEQLLDRLASLVSHGDGALVRLANSILNKVKQLEEQQSLSESVACERRFVSYNSKWLAGVTSTGARPGEEADGLEEEEVGELAVIGGHRQARLIDAREAPRLEEEEDEVGVHVNLKVNRREPKENLEDEEEDDDYEDDESLAEEPDLNVIDANSMIRHLTSRKELRAEWLSSNK